MKLLNVCFFNYCMCQITRPIFTCVYVLLYEGKCKWSYGPSRPVDFQLNIFIHSDSDVIAGESAATVTTYRAATTLCPHTADAITFLRFSSYNYNQQTPTNGTLDHATALHHRFTPFGLRKATLSLNQQTTMTSKTVGVSSIEGRLTQFSGMDSSPRLSLNVPRLDIS